MGLESAGGCRTGRGREGLGVDWPEEEVMPGSAHRQDRNHCPGRLSMELLQAAWIYAANFGGADPSSPI